MKSLLRGYQDIQRVSGGGGVAVIYNMILLSDTAFNIHCSLILFPGGMSYFNIAGIWVALWQKVVYCPCHPCSCFLLLLALTFTRSS